MLHCRTNVSRVLAGVIFGWLAAFTPAAWAGAVRIVVPVKSAPRIEYGAEQLVAALRAAGLDATISREAGGSAGANATEVMVGEAATPMVRSWLQQRPALANRSDDPGREGYFLASLPGGRLVVAGGDASGALYGCLELARRVREGRGLPSDLHVAERPAFVLRGPCVAMQKTYILPGRRVYEYPYTPELFPFFYDREFWREYLDFLAANRMNTLYLWNGHPFASLVRLKDYPDALEVTEEQFAANVAMFRDLTAECDRRGIWLVQMFYNILLPKPLADKHHLATQLSAPQPLAADYTRKAIAEFVRQFPNVGLMPCLGEALQGTANQIAWTTEVILPGVHDGMAAAGITTEPPVVFRTHAMDPIAIMPAAFRVYSNLFTETKFNGESLTTWEPRGRGQATHLAMSKLGPHLVNIHILANLEPFRYGAPGFIQKSVQAARDRLGATGVHLYPLSYWNWPDAPDRTANPLKQWDRDWIWFEAWARYAWNPDIEPAADRAYWIERIAAHYGSAAAAPILDAYNAMGEVAPRLIRRFGITEGNRQTLSLGMTLDQLVNPEKYGVLADLWESQSPAGERLPDYVEKDLAGQPHAGETPPQIIREVADYSERAVAALDRAAVLVSRNREEFARLRNDAACIRAMGLSYGAKAGAALHVLRFKQTGLVAEMEQARILLAESLVQFRALEGLTRDTYAFANSMQTAQRRIPAVGGGLSGHPANFHWTQLLPVYEKELADFDAQVTALKAGGWAAARAQTVATLRAAPFTVVGGNAEVYTIKAGARVFTDAPFAIESAVPELEGLKGIKFSHRAATAGRAEPVEINTAGPVRVLIGYVRGGSAEWRLPPRLETDAGAIERGGTEPLLVKAVVIPGLPPVDVYDLTFGPGRHRIEPAGTGAFLVLGVVAAGEANVSKGRTP